VGVRNAQLLKAVQDIRLPKIKFVSKSQKRLSRAIFIIAQNSLSIN